MRAFLSRWQSSWRLKIFILVIGVILTTFASFVFGQSWLGSGTSSRLSPILGACPIYPLFLQYVNHRQYNSALKWVFFWAIIQSIAVIMATLIAPLMAVKAIAHGEVYTSEMFNWIKTGVGAEGTLSLFLPIHLQHYSLFCLLCLITVGSAALILGTYLLNYMNFYVAHLINLSVNPVLAAIVGWPPWSVLRVMGYIISGIALTALSLIILAKLKKQSYPSFPVNYWLLGIGFIIADIVVKAIVAPFWRQLLMRALLG